MRISLTRRACMAAVALGALTAAVPAMAQNVFPSQPIKVIVPYPAGGATDALARMMAQKLGEA
jgi:tripartite-type tricarboxylate transporter receptor subunit TctC